MRRWVSVMLISTVLVLVCASSDTASVARPLVGADPAIGVPSNGTVYLGVSTDFSRIDAFDALAGISGHPAIYNRWTTPDGPFQPILNQVKTRPGLTPMISWNLPLNDLAVTSGDDDAYIRSQAAAVKAFRGAVFIRLDWEMNAFWYPSWNLSDVTPTQFVASWRRVVSIFRSAGASNGLFVWAPNVLDYFSRSGQRVRTAEWYPGDRVVDWIGLDAYPQSAPSATLLGETDGMNELAGFAQDHNKPLMLSEWAPNTPNPDTVAAVNLVFDWAISHPSTVKALVYFDFATDGKDFTLAAHPHGAAAFRSWTKDTARFLNSVAFR